jgi:hypothetical protein
MTVMMMVMAVTVVMVMPAMPSMMAVVAVMVVVAVVAVMPPMHLRGRRFGLVLHRRRGAGTAQRQRVGALGWSGESEQCADGRKP